MPEYKQPKLYGQRVPFSARMGPEQHRRLFERATALGLTQADYVSALVDRDCGLPNAIDDRLDEQKKQLPLGLIQLAVGPVG